MSKYYGRLHRNLLVKWSPCSLFLQGSFSYDMINNKITCNCNKCDSGVVQSSMEDVQCYHHCKYKTSNNSSNNSNSWWLNRTCQFRTQVTRTEFVTGFSELVGRLILLNISVSILGGIPHVPLWKVQIVKVDCKPWYPV